MTNEMTTEIALHCMKSAICEEVCEECPMYGEVGTDHCEDDAHRLAIQALEEIQQYRAIGTIEEFKSLKENQRKCEDCAGCTNWKCDCANIREQAITEFYDKVLNFEDYIEPKDSSEFGAVLLYSGKDITNMIVKIAEEMRGAE